MGERGVHDNTLECLRKHVSAFNPLEPLLEFTGAPPQTVRRWVKGKCKPMGIFLVRLRYFLESRGYPLESLEKLAPEVRDYGMLIACGRVSVEEAVRSLGITSQPYLFRILRGDIKSSSHVWAKKMREVVKGHGQTTGRGVSKSAEETVQAKVSLSKSGVKVTSDRQLILLALSKQISAMLPLAERVASDKFSVEDRRMLREMAGDGVIFRLSNLLTKLCGERAREIVLANSQPANAEG